MSRTRRFLAVSPAALLVSLAAAEDQPLIQTFQAQRLQIDGLIAELTIDVVPGGTAIQVSLSGDPEAVQKVRLSTSGDALVIAMEGMDSDWWDDMWNWSSSDSGDLQIAISMPQGRPVKIDHFIGDAAIGDLNAELRFNTSGGETRIGATTDAYVAIAGSGDITVGSATGRLEASIAGSGSVRGGDAGEASVEIAGGGEVELAKIARSLEIDIAGSGEVSAESVNGKVDIDVAGSGEVSIEAGTADPFRVDIAGSGDVRFGGTANNPDVSVMGSGDVWIAAYTGTLNADGAEIRVGQAQ